MTHPYSVMLRGDGAAVYRFAWEVAVFANPDALIEADALYWKCESWIPVVPEVAQSVTGGGKRLRLSAIRGGSASTERWWESDGCRADLQIREDLHRRAVGQEISLEPLQPIRTRGQWSSETPGQKRLVRKGDAGYLPDHLI